MSLCRRAVFSVSRIRPSAFAVQSRAASSTHDHDDHHHEDGEYPPETFVNAFWGKILFFSVLTGAAIKYAPNPGGDVYLTKWIAMYQAPQDFWLNLNAKHTAQASQVAENTLLVADAKQPPIHRFRYPQSLGQASPFRNPVGGVMDLRNVVVKTDKDVGLVPT